MKRKFVIPNTIDIYGQTIEILTSDEMLIYQEVERDGLACFTINKILMYNPPNRPQITLENTFFHELVHWMVYHASEEGDVTLDESFIQGTALLLHQYILSANYEKKGDFIPTSFECGATTIKVRRKKIVLDENGAEAMAFTGIYDNKIQVCWPDPDSGNKSPQVEFYCAERLEVAYLLQVLIFFSYFQGDLAFEKWDSMYHSLSFIFHQVLKQLFQEKK